MIEVEQRDTTGDGRVGDCWPCCFASILELPYEAVPNFAQMEHDGEVESAWNAAQTFLRARGLIQWSVPIWGSAEDGPRLRFGAELVDYRLHPTGYWVATVRSPRVTEECGACRGTGTYMPPYENGRPGPCEGCDAVGSVPGNHAVVMRGSGVAWDPHPLRDLGHLGFVQADFLMPWDER